MENITKLKAQTGPVLLAYKNTDKISEAINKAKVQKPVYNVFAHDGSNHKIWVVNNKDQIEKMLSEINSMESLFIADGHHRSAAAARVKEKFSKKNLTHDGNENYNYFFAVAFPHSEMTILDYNRIIRGLNGQSINSLISNIEKNYSVKKHSEEFKPVTKNTFGMYIDKNWYELNAIKEFCENLGVKSFNCTHWSDGGGGAVELAEHLVEVTSGEVSKIKYLYPDDMSLWEKMKTIAKEIYGASDIIADQKIRSQFDELQKNYGNYPICVAKTQYSFSTDPNLRGAPKDHVVPIREIRLAAGAEFLVVVCDKIMTMPGLPRVPAANAIHLNKKGDIEGLF